MPTIGILHPGDMGSVVGACAVAAGARVLWASEGRSAGSRERAAAAGLEDAGTVAVHVRRLRQKLEAHFLRGGHLIFGAELHPLSARADAVTFILIGAHDAVLRASRGGHCEKQY